MTITTPTTTATLEPWKRTARTVVAIVIAIATVIPWLVAMVHQNVDASTGLTVVLTQLTAVAAAITRFAASSAGNWLFGLIGLDATASAKLNTDVQTTATDAAPAIDATATAVKNPSIATTINAANADTAAAPVLKADTGTVAADVAAVQAPVVGE